MGELGKEELERMVTIARSSPKLKEAMSTYKTWEGRKGRHNDIVL